MANTGKAIKTVLWWEAGTRTTSRVNNSTVAATNLRAPCFCLWLIFITLYANQNLPGPIGIYRSVIRLSTQNPPELTCAGLLQTLPSVSLEAQGSYLEDTLRKSSQPTTSRASRHLSHPFRCLTGIAKHLFANNALRCFIQVRVEGALDLKKLRPQSVMNKRIGCAQNNRGLTLARIAVWFEPISAAQSGKQTPSPSIRQRKLRFDRAFRFHGSTQRSKNSAACRGCRIPLPGRCRALKKCGYLAQLLA